MFHVHIRGDLKLRDSGAAPESITPEINTEVERIWAEAQAETGGAFFNGTIFSVDSIADGEILGHFIAYKYLIAMTRRPELFSALRVQTLGVSGVLRCADGFVLGRRSTRVAQDAGLWELVPSGGIDPSMRTTNGAIDFTRHVLSELHEEVGISIEKVTAVQPLCVVEDTDRHLFDIAVSLTTPLSGTEVVALYGGLQNREYEAIRVVAPGDLSALIVRERADFVALTLYLIEALNLTSPAA